MRFQSHFVLSAALAAATPFILRQFGINLDINEILITSTAIIAGGNFPDTDCESKPSRIYAFLLVGFLTAFLIKGVSLGYFAIIAYPFLLAKIWGHRKVTHSWFLPVAIALIPFTYVLISINLGLKQETMYRLSMIYENYSIAFFAFAAGLCCHLFLDMKIVRKSISSIGGDRAIKLFYG